MKRFTPFLSLLIIPILFIASCQESKRELATGKALTYTIQGGKLSLNEQFIRIYTDTDSSINVLATRNPNGNWEIADAQAALDILVGISKYEGSQITILSLQLQQCRASSQIQANSLRDVSKELDSLKLNK